MFYTKLILSTIVFLFSAIIYGQDYDFNKFERLKSQGKIPNEFLTLTSEKYAIAKEDEDLKDKGDKKVVDEFILKSNYSIDQLLQGGKVLFNDPVSQYINLVADELLKDDLSLRRNLRFYLIRSNVTNAFATNQGIIFLTTGLISQLANEAQLAFVLGHEISHYTNEHIIDGYIEKDAAQKGKGAYKKDDYDEKIKSLSAYSKEKEMEADIEGAKIYLKSKYDFNAMVSTFDVLQFSHLPFDDIKWSSDFISSKQFFIPEGVFLDSINPIQFEDDYDDSESSHPNIKSRRSNLLMGFERDDYPENINGKLFIVSKEMFFEARDLCRFESVRSFIINKKYGKAIYNIYMLLKKYPDNPFLELSLVKAFYGLTKYKNNGNFYDIAERPKNIEGESFTLHYFIKNDLSQEMLNVMAYRLAYDYKKKHAIIPAFATYEKMLFEEMVNHSGIQYADLKSVNFQEALLQHEKKEKEKNEESENKEGEADETIEEKEESLSKYEKIRKKIGVNEKNEIIKVTEEPSVNNFYLFGLSDLINQPSFKSRWDEVKEAYEEKDDDNDLTYEEISDFNKKKKKQGLKLGIDKIVVVDPMFERYDLRKGKNLPLVSEKTKITLSNTYLKSAEIKGMEMEILDSKMMNPADLDKFNELSLVNEWLTERLNHDEDIDFYSSTSPAMDALRKKYGTDYFLFSSLLSAKIPKKYLGATIILGILVPYTLPFAIYKLASSNNECLFTFALFDVSNGDIIYIDSREIGQKHNDGLINSHVYDLIYQIHER